MTTTAHEDQFAPDPDAMEMVEVQISEAPPAALNWLMAKAEGIEVHFSRKFSTLTDGGQRAEFTLMRIVPGHPLKVFPERRVAYDPAGSGADGWPLIDRFNLTVSSPKAPVHRNGGPQSGWGESGFWNACTWHKGVDGRRALGHHETSGLIAALRAILISLLGEKAEVPWFLAEESAS